MQNYATETLAEIDERFYLESKTNAIVNNSDVKMAFIGVSTVQIYVIDVVTENNYQRSGTMRYGQIVEIGNGLQEFTMSQDKSFAISVDKANNMDSKMVLDIDEIVDRQVREVSVPTTDIYRLATLTAYAIANSQTATNALAYNDVFQKILIQRAALFNAKVPYENMVLYVGPTVESYLWRDPEFKVACDKTKEDRATGVIGTVMGMTIVVCPDSYYIANFGFMILSKKVLIAPSKINEIKTGDGFPFGISGEVAMGRRYYDAFIPSNKGVAIRLHMIA